MLATHEKFREDLPLLNDHPIIQKILWEIGEAKNISEFVKDQKKLIKAL
jgi:hypothetical protein